MSPSIHLLHLFLSCFRDAVPAEVKCNNMTLPERNIILPPLKHTVPLCSLSYPHEFQFVYILFFMCSTFHVGNENNKVRRTFVLF